VERPADLERPVTLEHLSFPGMSRARGQVLQRELDAMEAAARLFGAGLFGKPVQISWALGVNRPAAWLADRAGNLALHLWIDLESPLNLPDPSPQQPLPGPVEYKAAFRAGFLHALARVRGAPPPPAQHPLERALSPTHPAMARLAPRARDWLNGEEGRRVVSVLWERLEAARCDGLIAAEYRGAARHLERRLLHDSRTAASPEAEESLLGLCALTLREPRLGTFVTEDRLQQVDPRVRSLLLRETPYLRRCLEVEPVAGGYLLAEVVAHRLAFPLRELALRGGADASRPLGGHEPARDAWRPPRGLGCAEVEFGAARPMVGTQVVFLPHREGGEAMVRIDVAKAGELPGTRHTEAVLHALASRYGPEARKALAGQGESLRRALRVNWERRERGRYRSGKRIGIPNLRRFLTSDDLRLFQRLERPRSLSYYFHLLVDTSYSMLERDNAAKALAAAYAFAELLTRLRLPVDITLYSSGVTDLFDHRRDVLQPYFGAEFGYLVSGTLEMEAIAYAKAKAERLPYERKLFVVVTDGTPVTSTLPHVGHSDLAAYYTDVFIPWLSRAGIDLLAMGIGVLPAYHANAVRLTEGWESLGVLADLLEEVIRVGRGRTEELWL
jgi:hypothetical protein